MSYGSIFQSSTFLFFTKSRIYSYPPDNLNGAPEIENKEHNWFAVHFLQATKNDKEDEIPSKHLEEYYFNKLQSS